jgi:parvulin-like peptidyl-prolyl isomerase
MSRSAWRRAGPIAALCGVLALAACGEERPWVAQVGGKAIYLDELERAVAARVEDQPEASREDMLNQELDRLIQQRIALNRASELGVEISDEEVRGRLRELVGGDAHAIEEIGSPEYIETLRREMAADRAAVIDLAERLDVTESALVHWFEEHRERFNTPERVRISQIVVRDEAQAHALLKELRQGADFAGLARIHSIAPEAENAGRLPPFALGEMPEEFDQAFRLRPGQLSRVIASPFGFHIFRLEEKIPAAEPSLDDVRDRVRSELEQARLAELRASWLRELRRSAEIRVNDPLLEGLT